MPTTLGAREKEEEEDEEADEEEEEEEESKDEASRLEEIAWSMDGAACEAASVSKASTSCILRSSDAPCRGGRHGVTQGE